MQKDRTCKIIRGYADNFNRAKQRLIAAQSLIREKATSETNLEERIQTMFAHQEEMEKVNLSTSEQHKLEVSCSKS